MVYFANRVWQIGSIVLIGGCIVVAMPFLSMLGQQMQDSSSAPEQKESIPAEPSPAPTEPKKSTREENIEKCRKDGECRPILHWIEENRSQDILVKVDGANDFVPYYNHFEDYIKLSGLYEKIVGDHAEENKFKADGKTKQLKFEFVEIEWKAVD